MPKIQATEGDKLFGYAWSDNIGWISFNNCSNTTTCSGVSYGVTYDTETKLLKGYAWSPNIGLIKFGDFLIGNLPASIGGTSRINATLVFEDSNTVASLKGWARACAGTIKGDCNSATRTDGWDGWISLSGTGYGVKFDSTSGKSKDTISDRSAWGSDVIGWIDFHRVEIDPPPKPIIPSSIISFSGPSCVLDRYKLAKFSWVTEGMKECSIYSSKDGADFFNIPSVDLSSGEANLNINFPDSIYSLHCLDLNNATSNSTNNITITIKTICTPTKEDKKPSYSER